LFALAVLLTLAIAAGAINGGRVKSEGRGSLLTGIITGGGVDFLGVRSTMILWLLLQIMLIRGVVGREVLTISSSTLSVTVMSLSLIISIALPLNACLASHSLTLRSASATSGLLLSETLPAFAFIYLMALVRRLVRLLGGLIRQGIII
jgi:hypothetical protein